MSITEDILQVLVGCQRHGHTAEVLHIRRRTIQKLYTEALPKYLKADDPGIEDDADRLRVALADGGTLFGVKFVPEPDVLEIWVHGDGISS